jgi:diguanylate cyclase (GGDEF)-like protein
MTVRSPPKGEANDRLLGVIQTQTDVAGLGLDLGAVMALVAVRAQELTGASGAVIELAEGDEMVYRAATGVAEPHLGMRLRRTDSLSGRCIQAGTALRCDDSELDDRVDREACRRVGLRSMIVVPLRHHDQVVGVLKVLAPTPDAFDAGDTEILELMSGLVAAAMFHCTQYGTSALFHRATHDPLTGLPNRALFFDRLRHCLALANRARRRFAVLSLDMDGLKDINDIHGHRCGDRALQELADRLRLVTRSSDMAARVGGDEFGIVLCEVPDRDAVHAHATRLIERVCGTFVFEEVPIVLAASLGASLFPDDGETIESLLDVADAGMYARKRARRPAG